MSEMIERVARAIYERYERCEPFHSLWDAGGFNKDYWRDIARSAIEAMREPTPEMVEAAWADALAEDADAVWREMISTAINPSQT